MKYYNNIHEDLTVVLTGKRRQYVISNLKSLNIKYKYIEMVNFEKLNKLYNILDLYIVSSRFEGGPQSIMECATTKTPIISTDVGVAKQILSKDSIYKMKEFKNATPNIETAYKNVQQYLTPSGYRSFISFFRKL